MKQSVKTSRKPAVKARTTSVKRKTPTRSKAVSKASAPKGLHHHVKRVYHATPKFVHGMVVGGVFGLLVVGFLGSSALHPSLANAYVNNNAHCDVTAGDKASTFDIKGGKITATFTVTGTCAGQLVTLVSWQAPNGTDGKPYSSQVLYDHTTATFKPGQRTLTTGLPNCYYQVDLILGPMPAGLTGGAGYASGGILRRSLHGGTQACTQTPPVTPPSTPTPTPVQTTSVTSLPNTGPGAIITVFILALLGGYAFHMTHRHRQHKKVAHHTTHHRKPAHHSAR